MSENKLEIQNVNQIPITANKLKQNVKKN